MDKRTRAIEVEWAMWQARKRRNATLHATAVTRYTGIITAHRPQFTVLSVSYTHVALQCKHCGAKTTYSTRHVKRLETDNTPNTIVCSVCYTDAPLRPAPIERKPTAAELRKLYKVVDGTLVYSGHSKRYEGQPFGAVRYLKTERRERRYGRVQGFAGHYYADELVEIMNAQEETERSQDHP